MSVMNRDRTERVRPCMKMAVYNAKVRINDGFFDETMFFVNGRHRQVISPSLKTGLSLSTASWLRFPQVERKLPPPLMCITWPLIHSPSEDMSIATIAATSAGMPNRGLQPASSLACRSAPSNVCAVARVSM